MHMISMNKKLTSYIMCQEKGVLIILRHIISIIFKKALIWTIICYSWDLFLLYTENNYQKGHLNKKVEQYKNSRGKVFATYPNYD